MIGEAFKFSGIGTMLGFATMLLVTINSPMIPVQMLKVRVEGGFEITSLSITATIVILFNLFYWSTMTQQMKDAPNIKAEPDELNRVKLLLEMMESTSKICS